MKAVINSTVRILAIVLVIVGLYLAIMGSVKPTSDAHAVTVTGNGPHSESTKGAHFSQSGNWTARPYPYSLIGDCLADRTTDDLYPKADPYCIVTPAVVVVESERKDTTANAPVVPVVVPDTRPLEPNQEFPYEPPVVIPSTPETPVVVPTPETPETPAEDTCEHGNPGNTKCVGNAGENPNGAGTMPQDNAGGNGNGEHGNQGQGGNKPEKEDKSK